MSETKQNRGFTRHTPGDWDVYVIADKLGVWCGGVRLAVIDDRPQAVWYETHANAHLMKAATHAPHECADPACPGDINRCKLEAYDDLWRCLTNMVREWCEIVGDEETNSTAADTLEKARAAIAKINAV